MILGDIFTACEMTCLHPVWTHFTPCWKTCLHIVWNMFIQYSKTYLYRVERNSYSMLEDLILLGLIIMHLHNVWRQFSIIFENMLTHFLETFFCIMFEGMLCYVWRPVDIKFQARLKTVLVWGSSENMRSQTSLGKVWKY